MTFWTVFWASLLASLFFSVIGIALGSGMFARLMSAIQERSGA